MIDLVGQKFGRLLVIRREGSQDHQATWFCQCDCGNTYVAKSELLRNGHVKSCGCLLNEYRKNKMTKHGHGKHDQVYRLYRVWRQMKARCNNPNLREYKYYGGRGIKICPEWEDYNNFREWAFANGYDENAKWGDCTIDRINVDGNYEPDNCRWVNLAEQENNKQNTIYIEFNGEKRTITEWSKITGISRSTLKNRYQKGCEPKEIFEKPRHRQKTIVIEYEGESHTISEWSKIKGLSIPTITQRYLKGKRGSELFEPNKR